MASYWKSTRLFLLIGLKSLSSSIRGTIANAIALTNNNDSKTNSSNYNHNKNNNNDNLPNTNNGMSFLDINYKKTHNNRNNFKSNYGIR